MTDFRSKVRYLDLEVVLGWGKSWTLRYISRIFQLWGGKVDFLGGEILENRIFCLGGGLGILAKVTFSTFGRVKS